MQRYDKDVPIEDLKFSSTAFWVQVHDIPVRFMNSKVAEGICSTVGTVIRKSEMEMNGGSFMRVRVSVDVTHPLSRGRMVSVGQGKEKWVSFKYERLPNICYWCGCLNHDDRDCKVWLDSEGSLKVEEQQFGPWLCAPPVSRIQKNVISVLGFFHKKKGSLTTQRAPYQPRQAPAKSTTSSAAQATPGDVDQNNMEQSLDQLRELVTAVSINSPMVLEQNNQQVELLENQLEREKGDLKNIEVPPVEIRSASPLAISSHLFSPKKSANHVFESKEPVHKDAFLSELAEIDEGLSKLKAEPHKVNDSLIAKIPINAHVTSEEGKEAARVSQVLEVVNHANSSAATTETQSAQSPRQQGSWKRLNKADLPSKTDRNTSTVEFVLSTKRVYEELSYPNGLPRKKRAVSVAINSSKLVEVDAQPCPTQ